jgi:predicted  nucleic acid-binding Zn-ribbon protein
LQTAIEQLGKSKMHLVPITATKEGQAALAQAAKASIEEELTALQTEMQQFLQTPPERASTLMRRLEHFNDLRRKASLYQTVLQAQVEGLAENLTAMEQQVHSLLDEKRAKAA